MSKRKKWYVVWAGHEPGVYETWSECQAQTTGYPNAKFKAFDFEREARMAYEDGAYGFERRHKVPKEMQSKTTTPIPEAIVVDAACSGNPGVMEYRGVYLPSRTTLFEMGPFEMGTNNIGEFLAIVHALALMERQGITDKVIYSDSYNAILWVNKKHCKTTLVRNAETEQIYQVIARAEHWLKTHKVTTPVIKWETRQWGEIPADFGRKK